ncbi:MAG: PaREP1 family protein [Vulcanisaeta sp.]
MEELLRIAEENGIDVEELVMSVIKSRSGDPMSTIKLRIELAEKYLAEAREQLGKGDAVQASEKAYKAAEEVVKALAEKLNTKEYQQAVKEGRWYAYQLSSVAARYDWSRRGWSSAYLLHVWGFHEAKLTIDDVRSYVVDVEDMVTRAKEFILQGSL